MGSDTTHQNGWNEWSKHVLKELERLNQNYESINLKIDSLRTDVSEEIAEIRNDITKVKAMQYSLDEMKAWRNKYEEAAVYNAVKDIKKWKEEIDEISSPTQLKEAIKKVNENSKFRTQAITVFLVVQGLITAAFAIYELTK